MKHTPGPWKVGCYDVRFIFGSDGGLVAEACRGDAAEDFVNAHILAAALDMLEALKMVRDADNDNGREIPPLARAKIDAAIAKATAVEVEL